MVVVLPDWGPELGRALGTLAHGIRHAIDPNREFKERFADAATSNPDLMQNLTDYWHINGSLPPEIARHIPKELLDSIAVNEPSPNAIRTREAIRAAGGLSTGQRVALGQGELLRLSPVQAATQLQTAPLIPEVAGEQPGTVPTTLARAGAARAIGGLTAGQEAADRLKATLAPGAQGYLDEVQAYDKEHGTHYYEQTAAGSYDLLQSEQFRLTVEDRLMYMRLRQQERIDLLHEHEANFWVNKSGGMGSPDLWEYLLYDPKAQQRLQEIRSSGPKNAEDASLLRMQNYRESGGANVERALYIQSVVQRDKLMDAINGNAGKRILPDDDSRRPSDLAALNSELVREGTPFEAFWGPSADGSDSKVKLRFRSRAHKQIEMQPDQVQYGLQQADKAFSGGNLQVQQPRPAGAPQRPTRPAATVTPRPGANNAAGQYDLNTPAGYWEYLRSQDNVSPDSVITNRVRAKFNISTPR